MCVNQIYIKNTGYVPCGKCYECQMIRRNSWTCRMLIEKKYSKKAYFLTLTYNDDNLNNIDTETGLYLAEKSDYQNFLKRLRNDINLRYFGVHEYGTNSLRKHYHIIIFLDEDIKLSQNYIYNKWSKGMVSLYKLNNARIHYVTKYLNKTYSGYNITNSYLKDVYFNEPLETYLELKKDYILQKNTFNFMSLKPPIGYQLLEDDQFIDYFYDYVNRNMSYPNLFINGKAFPMPRFYISKLLDDDKRLEIYEISKNKRKDKERKEMKYYNLDAYELLINRYTKDEYKLNNVMSTIKSNQIL